MTGARTRLQTHARRLQLPVALAVLLAMASHGCGGPARAADDVDAGATSEDAGEVTPDGSLDPDGSVEDAAPPWYGTSRGWPARQLDAGDPCPGTLNPTGEFANALIRGRVPGSDLPGNSWEALEEAGDLGYEYVEVDVRLSGDGRFVPSRDDRLAGWSDCEGSLAESNVEDLADCFYEGTATRLLPIEEGLEGRGFQGVYLDLKSTANEPLSSAEEVVAAMTALVDGLENGDVVVAMSYDDDVAAALVEAGLRAALKGYPEGAIERFTILLSAVTIGAEMVCVPAMVLAPGDYERAAEDGIWLLPWAYAREVDAELVARLLAGRAGGLISSVPDRVSELTDAACE